jgi:hypothetical protein
MIVGTYTGEYLYNVSLNFLHNHDNASRAYGNEYKHVNRQ